MMEHRAAGVLLPVFSLPGAYGIGTMGQNARDFVDFLAEAGQSYWQILPLVPPGEGESPYMSPSSFAGNPLFIDLDELAKEGLLTAQELESAKYYAPDRVNYDFLKQTRMDLLRLAFSRAPAVSAEWPWLEEYAAFAARHDLYKTPWQKWPKPLAEPPADSVAFHTFLQVTFFRQWHALKKYANQRGVKLIGDLPIYVSSDSVEVFSHPELFQLDDTFSPSSIAGVPPDDFSEVGQLWGNPLYDWEGHKKEVFAWWKERMTWASTLYDVVRIDHFRGFHTYWSVPVGAADAREGHWVLGPGQELVDYLKKEVPGLEYIAEDLGDLDAKALDFIKNSGLPGMKVMVYAFDPVAESAYLPHNGAANSVMYTGTHDTPTFLQWLFDEATPEQRQYAMDYLRLRADEGFGWGVIAGAWASPCKLAIAPFQDVLGLGADARVNHPGTMGTHNWSWRVRAEAINPEVAGMLRKVTRTYRRCL